MLTRKNLMVSFVAVLLLALLAGCTGGAVMTPEREVEISNAAAIDAQNAAMAGLMAGSATWTESQFSSLVSELIRQNGGGDFISNVTVWFDPESMFVSVETPFGTVDLAGNVMVEDNMVQVDLEQAAALGMAVSGPLLDIIEGAINRALNDPSMGVAVGVEAGDGTLSVEME